MSKTMLNAVRVSGVMILCSIIIIALGGCSMSNYGKLKSNKEATQAFENYQILPNHKYFYRGTYSRPIAVVGIKEDFELVSNLWIEIDPNSKEFRTLIDRVSLQDSGSSINPWGFDIVDPSGNDVGIWYSAIRAAAVEINEKGQIVNLAPIGMAATGNQR